MLQGLEQLWDSTKRGHPWQSRAAEGKQFCKSSKGEQLNVAKRVSLWNREKITCPGMSQLCSVL